jgi:hypothetical protein
MNEQDSVEQAKSALRVNAYGSFEEQAPHLRCLLEHLPCLAPGDPGEQMNLDSVLERLRAGWACQHPAGSHDGAIHVEVGGERRRLILTFHLFLWGKTSEVRRFEIVRVGEDEFVYREQR